MKNISFILINGGYHVCTPKWRSEKNHPVNEHRFYFIRSGLAELTVNQSHVQMVPHQVYFIPADQPIDYHCPKRMTLDWLHFQAEDIYLNAWLSQIPKPICWPAQFKNFWKPTYRQMATLFAPHPPEQLVRQVQAMLLYATSELVADKLNGLQNDDRSQWMVRLEPAVAWMDQCFCHNPTLAELADRVHLSPVYFHKQFCHVFHVTPHAYMLRRRMQLASELLRSHELNVSEVSEEVGYPNVFYFSRTFKKFFGYTPRDLQTQKALVQP